MGATPDSIDLGQIMTVLCDLDGVIWLDHEPIPGSVDAVRRLRSEGCRVLFVTNFSGKTQAQQCAALAGIGIVAEGDIVTSAMAAAAMVEPGERVLVSGGPGIVEAIGSRGAMAIVNDGTDPGIVDAVIVGIDRNVDYDRLTMAARAIRRGARFIGTNDDATFPTPFGLAPGAGALIAAVATAAGVEPAIAGKPHGPMRDLIVEIVGPTSSLVMVGDRPDSDGFFAVTLGCPFVLVRTGVVGPDEPTPVDPPVAVDVADLAAFADQVQRSRS